MWRFSHGLILGLGLGALIYPATDLTLKLTVGRTLLHPDH